MRINEVIVVEGKSDTRLLKSLFECDTIETNGSAISDETIALIKQVNNTRGIIVFTDPDYPGMRIREIISQAVPNCKHAFLDKSKAIGKGKVGVAEGDRDAIKEAILNSVSFSDMKDSISWQEFVSLDIIGNKENRLYLFDYFHLGYGNNKALFKRMNMAQLTKQDVIEALARKENK